MDTVIAAIAAFFSAVSVMVAWRARGAAARAAEAAVRSADAAEAAEHRASSPRLLVEAEGAVQRDATEVIYLVHNLDGPDLASVVVHRPVVSFDTGGVFYGVAATGRGEYGETAEIGPIPLAECSRFTLSVGSAATLPDFRVAITSSVANSSEAWRSSHTLVAPRGS